MADEKWGNPETQTFERYKLRWATYGEYKVHVHFYIWPIANAILLAMGQMEFPMGGLTELDDPLKRGFRMVLDSGDQALIVPQLEELGFTYREGDFLFEGSSEKAQEISKRMVAPALEEPQTEAGDVPEDVEAEPKVTEVPAPWSGTRIEDTREDFILFVQYLTGCEVTGQWDDQTVAALKSWQDRHGVAATGLVDDSTWDAIIPARVGWLRPGATGAQIKVIQAGFKALGYMEQEVNGIWGMYMSRALRQFQADHGIHQRLRIGNPEWDALFQRP